MEICHLEIIKLPNIDKIEETGIKPLEEILNYFGGWPITMHSSDWSDDGHDWQTIHEFYTVFRDLSSFFNFHVTFDHRNTSRNTIMVRKSNSNFVKIMLTR